MTQANQTEEIEDHRYRWIGTSIVIVVFGIFGIWAALAPLSSAALAPGVLIVESYRKTVQHLEGGIIKEINIKNGDIVKAGQQLILLDDTEPKTQLQVLMGQYYIALAREARLLAQQTHKEDIVYPELLQEHKLDERIAEAKAMQSHNFRVRKNAHEGEMALYARQTEQLKARAKGLTSQRNSQYLLTQSYQAELDDFNALLKEGYAEKQRVREYERNLAQSKGLLGEIRSSIAETQLQISEIEMQMLQLSKEFQREVATELSEVQTQLFDLREQIQLLEDTVKRTVVTAPVSGMAMELSVHTLGAVISPGAKLVDIVPQGEKIIIEARVSPIDIDRVMVGQTAEVRLSAFKARDLPKIEGRLVSLSADRLVDEHTENAEAYFMARLEINQQGMDELHKAKLELIPGMPAEVLVLTGDRTMLQYLFEPLSDAIAHSFIED